MLEFPEVLTIASQLTDYVVGMKIKQVLPPSKVHKFCWYIGDVNDYHKLLKDSKITSVEGFGIFVEISFDNGYKLSFNDGVNIRFINKEEIPKNYQLLIELDNNKFLVFTVAMYGGIYLHRDNFAMNIT